MFQPHSLILLLFYLCYGYQSVSIPLQLRATGDCDHYTIIDTRGTNEPQGESIAVRMMNQKVLSSTQGGQVVDTVYSADNSQNLPVDSNAILKTIDSILTKDPTQCLILQGFSQGAAATTFAMPKIDEKAFNQIKAVILLGNPLHHPNNPSDVISKTGEGKMSSSGEIPSNWNSKTMDICNAGDPVCQGTGNDWTQHGEYASDEKIQSMAADFMIKQLQGGGEGTSTTKSDAATPSSDEPSSGGPASLPSEKDKSKKESNTDPSTTTNPMNVDPNAAPSNDPSYGTPSIDPSYGTPSIDPTTQSPDPSTADPNASNSASDPPSNNQSNAGTTTNPLLPGNPNSISDEPNSPTPNSEQDPKSTSPSTSSPSITGLGPQIMPPSSSGSKGFKQPKRFKLPKGMKPPKDFKFPKGFNFPKGWKPPTGFQPPKGFKPPKGFIPPKTMKPKHSTKLKTKTKKQNKVK